MNLWIYICAILKDSTFKLDLFAHFKVLFSTVGCICVTWPTRKFKITVIKVNWLVAGKIETSGKVTGMKLLLAQKNSRVDKSFQLVNPFGPWTLLIITAQACEVSVSVEFSALKSRFPYFWTRAKWGGRKSLSSQFLRVQAAKNATRTNGNACCASYHCT